MTIRNHVEETLPLRTTEYVEFVGTEGPLVETIPTYAAGKKMLGRYGDFA
jgi:hypothetical protein